MKREHKIGIVGLGYVGLSLASALSEFDFEVYGVDIDEKKIKLILSGESPFYDRDISRILPKVINKTLFVSVKYDILRDCDVVFICVNVPNSESKLQDLGNLIFAINELIDLWKDANLNYRVIVIKSTILPGTTNYIRSLMMKKYGQIIGKKIDFVVSPEFMRTGNGVKDILYPHRVIIGSEKERASCVVKNIYKKFYSRVGVDPPILEVSTEEAELIKYASNVYLGMKISYINFISDICEKLNNCDVQNVIKGMSLDPRIGKNYLKPGIGFGGPCLPKDIEALLKYSIKLNLNPKIIEGILEINEMRPYKIVNLLKEILGDVKNKVISILGVAFKPGTDDIQNSPSLEIIKCLMKSGAKIKIHDPLALNKLANILSIGNNIILCKSVEQALRESDAIVICTDWKEYAKLTPQAIKKLMKQPVIIDGRRVLSSLVLNDQDIVYIGIGISSYKKSKI